MAGRRAGPLRPAVRDEFRRLMSARRACSISFATTTGSPCTRRSASIGYRRHRMPATRAGRCDHVRRRRRLEDRVYRLRTGFAWSQAPASRTVRLITNVEAFATRSDDVRMLRSNFLISEFWGDETRLLAGWAGHRLVARRRWLENPSQAGQSDQLRSVDPQSQHHFLEQDDLRLARARHCERSEAIQRLASPDCSAAGGPRNDEHVSSKKHPTLGRHSRLLGLLFRRFIVLLGALLDRLFGRVRL